MCLNSAAKRPKRQKNDITRIHSHAAAPEEKPVMWKMDTEGEKSS